MWFIWVGASQLEVGPPPLGSEYRGRGWAEVLEG